MAAVRCVDLRVVLHPIRPELFPRRDNVPSETKSPILYLFRHFAHFRSDGDVHLGHAIATGYECRREGGSNVSDCLLKGLSGTFFPGSGSRGD